MSRLTTSSRFVTTTSAALLAALTVTGCGQDSKPAPAESSASSSSSQSASAEGTESSGSSASSSASASDSESAVANGEYKPADENGPAQNVPKPVKPEGMDVETPEAMEMFIYYWNDLSNYSTQTGDTSEIRKYTAASFDTYMKNFATWDQLYKDGGWIAGGLSTPVPSMENVVSLGDGYYAVPINYENTDVLFVDNKGEQPYYESAKLSEDNGTGYELRLQFSDSGNWYVIDQKIVGAQ